MKCLRVWLMSTNLESQSGHMLALIMYLARDLWLCPGCEDEIWCRFNPIALVVIGLSLFLGLGSRWLSLGGVLLLLMYYLSYPPFIGLDQPMAEGNYLIVNKNMIEACALVVLYFFPECHQVGLNRFFRR